MCNKVLVRLSTNSNSTKGWGEDNAKETSLETDAGIVPSKMSNKGTMTWTKTTYIDRHGREEHVLAREPKESKERKEMPCECDGDCTEYEKDGVVVSWRCEHCGKLHIDSKGGK